MNTVVIALLSVAIVLIATKHYLASLSTSLVATLIIMFAMLPCDSAAEGSSQFSYAPNRAIKVRAPGAKQRTPATPPVMAPPASPRAPMRASLGVPPVMGGGVTTLPSCNDPPPPLAAHEVRDYIRNHGLYGVHGNLNCRHMQRGSVSDHGQLQPLNARNQLLKFLAYDQPHEKDPFLIPNQKTPQ